MVPIFCLKHCGKALGRWQIDVDKPQLGSNGCFFPQWQGYLLFADVGDNFARRQSVSFLVVEEPKLETDQQRPLPVAWQVEFSYPNGPRDSEAVAVDPATERVLILSKRTFPNELYWVPLRVGKHPSGF